MIRPLRHSPISVRLVWMNILVTGTALAVACAAFLAYDFYAYRQAAIESLAGMAKIVGANSVTAIVFNDQAAAQTTLSALNSADEVASAAIYTNSGAEFARFVREGPVPSPRRLAPGALEAHWSSGLDVLTVSRIEYQGKPVGSVYIHARLEGLRRQALQHAGIVAVILLLCLWVALVVGNTFRKVLAEPIVSLAETARLVSRSRDYSLRFTPPDDYQELMLLVQSFNEMLREIQLRDGALETAKADLEARVEERTAQLQAANQEMEAFSYTVAHDLRSPLQAISNAIFLIGMEQTASGRPESLPLTNLNASVSAMSGMIDDLLNLSRSTSAELHLIRVDLGPMAQSILDSLAKADPARRVKAVVHPHCIVHADAGLIEIVLENLLRNAWKFTGKIDDATIEFGCVEERGRTVVFVRDDGAGFDPRLAGRLFKPFQRLHKAAEFPGTGIGLATVRRIVARHEGRVWAEGEVGKGATFRFTLESCKEESGRVGIRKQSAGEP